MKRYALFSGNDYYPLGGFKDFKEWGDDPRELAKIAVDRMEDDDAYHDYQWWQVVDILTGQIISKVD
jgi:hypothetical protein